MHAEHVHQKAQKSQRATIGLDHHGLGQSAPPPPRALTDIFLATGLLFSVLPCDGGQKSLYESLHQLCKATEIGGCDEYGLTAVVDRPTRRSGCRARGSGRCPRSALGAGGTTMMYGTEAQVACPSVARTGTY